MIVVSSSLRSQSINSGLGIEVGLGYNQLYWQVPIPAGVAYKNPLIISSNLALTPEVRIKYVLQMTNYLSFCPFIGYNRFGGYRINGDDAYDEKWFDAFDLGVLGSFNISNISFSFGYQANRINNVTLWYYIPNDHAIINLTDELVVWAQDVGFRVSYDYGHFNLAIESWFGISELAGSSLPSESSIRENHFRLMAGYTL
jgi:hypothetical protein